MTKPSVKDRMPRSTTALSSVSPHRGGCGRRGRKKMEKWEGKREFRLARIAGRRGRGARRLKKEGRVEILAQRAGISPSQQQTAARILVCVGTCAGTRPMSCPLGGTMEGGGMNCEAPRGAWAEACRACLRVSPYMKRAEPHREAEYQLGPVLSFFRATPAPLGEESRRQVSQSRPGGGMQERTTAPCWQARPPRHPIRSHG